MTPEPILDVVHSTVGTDMPRGACDCHVHVFGPRKQFPLWNGRSYTPPPAPVEALAAHQAALNLDRVIVVQPSIYGTDNTCTLDAIRMMGPGARGVAVVDRHASPKGMEELASGGIVGIRLNLAAGSVSELDRIRDDVRWAFALTEKLGWHVQIFTELGIIAALEAELKQAPVPVVIDHFGRADADRGLDQPGLDTLISLVSSEKVYVKLSAPYLVSADPQSTAVGHLVRAFVKANPDRLLWGSNWPHPGGGTGASSPHGVTPFRPVDDAKALDRIAAWVDSSDALRSILVRNPAKLFGFADEDGLK
ncbi:MULTISPECIES: amidohydrolase family protein [unclassified Mesorhizobium]|uniref:amidohydrolase family protein n=1 Tax=unclassified Mesorhizobium TaxID=325217 RepID=UPI002414E66E|nr:MULTISPECIES: amidohydrolase family protein [unclassified Mesorhizobium]MDG4889976.1 amidohydrolase family protein [Mesorhizobium sp. WSM4887]MDG4904118.1 amidohydrolase family protein [Mesorhizobium sp. WSM4962]MDG4909145.1 amidohydrolase family protein [Mesorhizobium sp. WSM4898]MDG4921769.1 amidohydrolase family protein [Mesorhizobium sp. WSM4989]